MKLIFSIVVALLSTTILAQPVTDENVSAPNGGGTVAILPASYINDVAENDMEEMPYGIQQDIFTFLANKSAGYTYQQPEVTNSLLLKNNITNHELRKYTTAELAGLLGVSYVVRTEVTQRRRGETNIGTSSRGKGERRTKVNTGTTSENYMNRVTVSMYDEQGRMIFNESRKSLLSGVNAYNDALKYLLKRMPLYAN